MALLRFWVLVSFVVALISYKGDWLAYKQANGWWASALETTPSAHLALDIF